MANDVEEFHRRHHDPAIAKAADKRMSNASHALSQAGGAKAMLHPMQFHRARKERDAAVLHSKEYGSGAKYHEPHGVTH